MAMQTKVLQIRLPAAVKRMAKKSAKSKNISMSEYIRRLIHGGK